MKLLIAATAGIASVLFLAGCVNSSGPGAGAGASAHLSPQQQLAGNLIGMTTRTGATVESATVGDMCSATGQAEAYDALGSDEHGQGCILDTGDPNGQGEALVPASRWLDSGVWTCADGEVQLSDGSQAQVAITVDNKGKIQWQQTP